MRLELPTILIAASVLARSKPVHACGPDFDPEMLAQRTTTLYELAPQKFMAEVATLVPHTDLPTVFEEPAGARERGGPEERALYDRGAAAFHAKHLDDARGAFAALLALPADQRRQRSTWAAYMLGRSYPPLEQDAEAIAAFRQVRALAAAGFADELGLAYASLGEEARRHAHAGDPVTAVRMYAEQGDGPSLLIEARIDARFADERAQLLGDPVGQRLLAIYLSTRGDDMAAADRDALWVAMLAVPRLAGADHLAAAAYRDGNWDLAARLASQDPDAQLSLWVRAKLALRDGDHATAEGLLARVATTCGRDDETAARVASERAVVALATDRPLDAMTRAWEARVVSPADLTFVAERVLTVEELRAFVDRLPPDPPPVVQPVPPFEVVTTEPDEDGWKITTARMRELLARRLMREGRAGDAYPYFMPEHAALARRYADALARGHGGDADPIDRAGALLDAAAIARHDGLEILGTEFAPDWKLYGAQYDRWWERDEDDEVLATTITEAERARVSSSAPQRGGRYHYRYVASALAEEAANLLPHRSQAFASALCQATKYIFFIDDDRKTALYLRYIHEGPRVEFSSSFGQDCDAPELARARRFLPHSRPSRAPIALAIVLYALAWAIAHRRAMH